jgi:hypothetical protein
MTGPPAVGVMRSRVDWGLGIMSPYIPYILIISLVTNELYHDTKIPHPIRRSKCVRNPPFAKSREGWGTPRLWDGQGLKSLGCATRPCI